MLDGLRIGAVCTEGDARDLRSNDKARSNSHNVVIITNGSPENISVWHVQGGACKTKRRNVGARVHACMDMRLKAGDRARFGCGDRGTYGKQ